MRSVYLGLVILAVVLILVSSFLFLRPSSAPKFTYNDTTTPENVASSLTAQSQETFSIRLASNPSTGYDWRVNTTGPLQYLNWTTVGGGGLPGATVVRDYRFIATGRGFGQIILVYERGPPGFANQTILKTIRINATVLG